MQNNFLDSSYIEQLENEAIYILREVAATAKKSALLFSGGKDSVVLLRLAEKAFRPMKFPFPLLHIDTGHNFPEVIAFRDKRVEELNEKLIVGYVEDSIARGSVTLKNKDDSRNAAQSVTLLGNYRGIPIRCPYRWGQKRRRKSTSKGTDFFF